jgi:hypothetical protein
LAGGFGFSLKINSHRKSPPLYRSLAFIGITAAKSGSIRAARLRQLATKTLAGDTAVIFPPTLTPPEIMDTNNDNSPFGKIICSYTRAQAIADGLQVEVTDTGREAGIRFPVFLTRAVFNAFVTVPPGVTGQDEAGRLWDILNLLRFAIYGAKPGQTCLPLEIYVRNDNHRPQLVKLIALCGPLDIHDPQPAITVLMPEED